MSALPPGDLTLSPQMMSVGFSLANIAIADTRSRLREALREFDGAVSAVQERLAGIREAKDKLDEALSRASASDLRRLLEVAASMEIGFGESSKMLASLLGKGRFKTILNQFGLRGHVKVARFSKELNEDIIPLFRDVRLRAICLIAERANDAGVCVLDVSGDFPKVFKGASFEETESWQETAYILANLEAAKILNESINSSAIDKTTEFLRQPANGPSLH